MNGDNAFARRDPAANSGIGLGRMATFSGKLNPTDFGIGQISAALPGGAGEARQRREGFDTLDVFIEDPVTIFPGGQFGNDGIMGWLIAQEIFSDFDFTGGWNALIEGLIKFAEAFLLRNDVAKSRTAHQIFGAFGHERAVEQVKGLLGHRGLVAARAGGVRIGKVEHAKEIGKLLPVDETVNRAPTAEVGRDDINRLAAQRRVELAGDDKKRIAHRLKIKPVLGHFPEQLIVGIAPGVAHFIFTALLVGGRKHDRPMEFLH